MPAFLRFALGENPRAGIVSAKTARTSLPGAKIIGVIPANAGIQTNTPDIPLTTKNTPFRLCVFSPIAALQKLDIAPLCLRSCALLSTKIHAP